MRDGVGPAGKFRGDDRIQWDHRMFCAAPSPHIYLADVAGVGSVLRHCLCLHAIDTSEFYKIVHVQIPEISLHGVKDFRNRHTERFGAFAVNRRIQAGGAYAKIGAGSCDRGVFHGLGYEFLGGLGELGEIAAAGILQLKGKTTRGAETPDRRGIECEDKGLGNFRELLKSCRDKTRDLLVRIRASVPMVQRHEHRGLVRPPGSEDKILPSQSVCRMDRRNCLEIILYFTQHLDRSCLGSAIRQLDNGNKVTLIFFRKEAVRDGFEEAKDDEYQHSEDDQSDRRSFQNDSDSSGITGLHPVKRPVEHLPESLGLAVFRLENKRTESRAEGKRHES